MKADPLDAMARMAANIDKYGKNPNNLTCGAAHQQVYDSTGLESGLGWCALSKIWLTGKKLNDKTSSGGHWKAQQFKSNKWIAARLSINSADPECLSRDGSTCVTRESKDGIMEDVKQWESDGATQTIRCGAKDYQDTTSWCVQARRGVGVKNMDGKIRALRMSRTGNELECLKENGSNSECATRSTEVDMNKFIEISKKKGALNSTVCQPDHTGAHPVNSWCAEKYRFLGYDWHFVKVGASRWIAVREDNNGTIVGLSRDGKTVINGDSLRAIQRISEGYGIYGVTKYIGEGSPLYAAIRKELDANPTLEFTKKPFMTESGDMASIDFFAEDEEVDPEPEPFEGMEFFATEGNKNKFVPRWKWGDDENTKRITPSYMSTMKAQGTTTMMPQGTKTTLAGGATTRLTTLPTTNIQVTKATGAGTTIVGTTRLPIATTRALETKAPTIATTRGTTTKAPTTMVNPFAGRTTTLAGTKTQKVVVKQIVVKK